MINVLLVVQILLAFALIGFVLLQKNEGGALGMGGGSMSNFMTGRGTANFLSRGTAILAALFMISSLALTMVQGGRSGTGSITDRLQDRQPASPEAPVPVEQAPAIPAPATE